MNRGGPAVVAIGGGHGLAASLTAVRCYASAVTAVVSVADDGGSSGRLRELLGIPAPGDLRKCLGALVGERSILSDALEQRFAGAGELEGHAFGNLLIAALASTAGSFVGAMREACRLLGTVGPVLPATTVPVVLKAEAAGCELEGQVRIMASSGITRVSLVPDDAEVPAEVTAAIAAADQVVVGPGSLYTSVLAALAPEPIRRALRASAARVVYVCNLREQVPETAGYDVGDHVRALHAHGVHPHWVVADPDTIDVGELPGSSQLWTGRLAAVGGGVHDPDLLCGALRGLD